MHNENSVIIHHVIVVGFHHKKGCQVEYCYPPLDGTSKTQVSDEDLPLEWKHISTLALPDGAHNCEKDAVFFHLPSYKCPGRTLYGVSCYRQISTNKLKNKSNDVTRSTVQKSVCVISSAPLYGLLHTKLELITQAYFEQCDFAKVELLADMYEYLKLNVASIDPSEGQYLFGLSPREVYMNFGNQLVVLFKLILLEKRVFFHMFPVHRLCRTILSILSLFPSLIEKGLDCCLQPTDNKQPLDACADVSNLKSVTCPSADNDDDSLLREIEEALNQKLVSDAQSDPNFMRNGALPTRSSSSLSDKDEFGFPLEIFHKGSMCHPYLSLAYVDSLKSESTSFVAGATNALFKHRRFLYDVLVTIDDDGISKIDIVDPELKKVLALTTADLRFADFLFKHVFVQQSDPHHPDVVPDYEWEGGDEWVRLQFRAYLLSLMATVKVKDSSKYSDFNEFFVDAWQQTHNCRAWISAEHSAVSGLAPGHPFNGQLSVTDMKLRLSHSVLNTEQGRKLNQAVLQTGKYMQQTGKAVGSVVRNAVSQFWSSSSSSPKL